MYIFTHIFSLHCIWNLFAATWIERMGGEQLIWNGMECEEMIQQDDQMPGCLVMLLMEEVLHKLRLVVYPIICRVVLYIPGGCLGFQPSTVSSTTWQGSCQSVLMPRGYCSFARKPKGRQRQALRGSGFHHVFLVPSLKLTVRTENGWLEYYFPFGMACFQVPC